MAETQAESGGADGSASRPLSFQLEVRPCVDLSGTPVRQARLVPDADTRVDGADGTSPAKRAAAKNLRAWANRLTSVTDTDEEEREAVESTLRDFGSVRTLLEELALARRENKKLRFREQRFAHEPLLRRRRVDLLSPSLLRVLVVALQNELAAATETIRGSALESHPMLRAQFASGGGGKSSSSSASRRQDEQDLDALLRSGLTGVTSVRASVGDLGERQRDIVEGGLREQNRLLRQQVMRLQACLSSLPWAKASKGGRGSPRLGNGFDMVGEALPGGEGGTAAARTNEFTTELGASMSSNISSSSALESRTNLSMTSTFGNTSANAAIQTLKQRVQDCAVQIERLQQELTRTQSELVRTELTVNAQLEIEAKLVEEKAKVARTNAQMGAFVLKVLQECKPKLAEAVRAGIDLEGWFDEHRRARTRGRFLLDSDGRNGSDFDAAAHEKATRKTKEAEAAKKAEMFSRSKRHRRRSQGNMKESSTQTGSGLGGGSAGGGRRRNSRTGGTSNEYSSDEDDDRDPISHGKNNRPLSSTSDRSSPTRPRDGRRRRERPSSAASGRRRSPASIGKPASFDKKGGKSSASLLSDVKKMRNLKNDMGIEPGNTGKAGATRAAGDDNDDESEADMFRTTRLPGIVTPLDFSRAVGIDPFSVPAKLEDRQTYEERHPKSTLHPDHMSADMKRPVIAKGDIPHSARILRVPGDQIPGTPGSEAQRGLHPATPASPGKPLTGRREDTIMTRAARAERRRAEQIARQGPPARMVVAKDLVPFLQPVIVKYEKVLRQVFSHFSQTQARPIGTTGLFEEIAQWTTSLTHATFFKILAHFLVVPKLMSKKHAFALLLGTERKISFPDFIARLLDVAKMLSPRLFVLSDVASVELLEQSFLECAERENLLPNSKNAAGENGSGISENDENPEDAAAGAVVAEPEGPGQVAVSTKSMQSRYLTKIVISSKTLRDFFSRDPRWKILFRSQDILAEMCPEDAAGGLWGWSELRSFWWNRCSLSREAVAGGSRSDLLAAFNLPNILPPRVVSPSRRARRDARAAQAARRNMQLKPGRKRGPLTKESQAIALELLLDFIVQTELPTGLAPSRRRG